MIFVALLLSIIIFIAIFGASMIHRVMFQYIPKVNSIREHYANSKGTDEYKEFYDIIHNVYMDPEYKCKLAQSKIDHHVRHSPEVVAQSKKYVSRFCSDDGSDENVKVKELTDIDATDPTVFNKIYKEYCFGKFGILGNKQPLKQYTYGFNNHKEHHLNQIPVNRLPISRNHCRQLEDIIIKTKQGRKTPSNPPIISTAATECSIGISPQDAYNECKDKFRESEINKVPLPQYRYYKKNDGTHYINDASLNKLDANLENCRIVNDILYPSIKSKLDNITKNNTVLNSLNDSQISTLCKRTHELDLICSKYDKNTLRERGKYGEIQTRLYNFNNPDTGKIEYHFLSPDELEIVNKNVHRGKSGLSIANEMNMCCRKQQIDETCNI
jgi:hypothetical protein